MKAAIYARVSTSDQHNEIQIRELTEYCARRGWEIHRAYTDEISGAKAKRPGLDALMHDARLRRFDAVLVWKMDRFGRSLMNCVAGIQELDNLGIRFLAVSQNIDTDHSNPTSRLLANILACVAEFERELICERTRAGLQHARKQGKTLGRPTVIFDRFKARELQQSGLSVRQIASELGVKPSTVQRSLKATA